MIKKIISALSFCLCICILFSGQAYAAIPDQEVTSYTEIFDDGSSLTTTISEYHPAGAISTRSNTKTGTKTVTYKNANHEKLWSFSVTGTYTYNGSSATCTSVSHSYSIERSTWKYSSASSSRSGNKATGTIVMKLYIAGVCMDTVTRTVTLSCSANGTLS